MTPDYSQSQPQPQAQADQAQAAQTQSQGQGQSQSQDQAPQQMKKGIYLSALIYVEGMQAPADDFASLAKSAVTGACAGDHGGLSITVKNLHVENNVGDDSGGDDGEGKQATSASKGGFEF